MLRDNAGGTQKRKTVHLKAKEKVTQGGKTKQCGPEADREGPESIPQGWPRNIEWPNSPEGVGVWTAGAAAVRGH